jgi:hypothetical protein
LWRRPNAGTERIPRSAIAGLISEYFDLRPAAFRSYLKLHRPVYALTAAYGHFGRDEQFTWSAPTRRRNCGTPPASQPPRGVIESSGQPAVTVLPRP